MPSSTKSDEDWSHVLRLVSASALLASAIILYIMPPKTAAEAAPNPSGNLNPDSPQSKSDSDAPNTFSRIMRSLSKKETKAKDKPSASVIPTYPEGFVDAPPTTGQSSRSKDGDRTANPADEQLTAFQRFIRAIGVQKKDEPPFPPPHWVESGLGTEPDAAAAVPLPPTPADELAVEPSVVGPTSPPPDSEDFSGVTSNVASDESTAKPKTIAERLQSLLATPITNTLSTSKDNNLRDNTNGSKTPDNEQGSSGDAVPEPQSVAQRIQTLLSASFTPTASRPTTPGGSKLQATEKDPSPQPTGSALADSKLVGLLSSASVMNGSLSKGRQSVWAALDRLRPTSKPDNVEQKSEDEQPESVMVYGPLIPEAGSQVELAESEIVEVDEDGTEHVTRGQSQLPESEPTSEDKEKGKGKSTWPWKKSPSQPKKPREVKVWIPSASKISLQATWWGYRLYLPPPVLDVLSSKQLEATKRAAIITGSLQFFLTKIPVTILPIQLRGPALIIQRLAPFLSYVGAFIAWSWEGIKSFDKGQGVVLTATWVVPVALVPSSWDLSIVPVDPDTIPPEPPADYEGPSYEAYLATRQTDGSKADKGKGKEKEN